MDNFIDTLSQIDQIYLCYRGRRGYSARYYDRQYTRILDEQPNVYTDDSYQRSANSYLQKTVL